MKVEPHGNSKINCRPYIRTQHSTLEDIKNTVATVSPRSAIKTVYDDAGGIINVHSISELPRNLRQATNAKSQVNSVSSISSNGNKDLIYDLLEQNFKSLKTFVRSVSFDSSVACVLASEQQLRDLERFCANDQLQKPVYLG